MKKILKLSLFMLALCIGPMLHAQAATLPTPTAHGASLTWVNTCDATVTCSFNVYRCTGSATACTTGTGTWQLLTLTTISAPAYSDQAVTTGTTYQYLVYATATVNGKVQTSSPSNQWGGTIPLGPTPVVVSGSVS
jgi:hypothetical protein